MYDEAKPSEGLKKRLLTAWSCWNLTWKISYKTFFNVIIIYFWFVIRKVGISNLRALRAFLFVFKNEKLKTLNILTSL